LHGFLALILMLLTIVGMIAASLLIMLLAPGLAWQETQHELAVQMLPVTFPYLFFIRVSLVTGAMSARLRQYNAIVRKK